ncbi:hypothetical protein A3A54_01660 [Candidatus Curtissbacteria bacterium RIFCSPLOWO2_01_FULL_39_62]|uniref:Peptidoglycan hydrolase PcsB coiled-coil domain-containing protein n=2 Tax=Candidatus Curtissiibacteriota TaxID=1752717 RepID=A0A1F5GC01_9BACT|nr:MAG: hypothetical protein A3D04_03895 [Candidatus Curtissbacteria bacterium RIFCSPHIGHO2_02_FULL_40_16b]OGE01045.1 MAG: hypothetical protein A3J17_03600 [Candidatus Curtissbacteria bacterium RIFCSPLOWO2_02_FULL_40_11]OGE02723.1 MAG: hypothetical protein A3A54_01660 [Candidatus Curtissbacteria bacterium RIFCSPLOWO2_01_FULL_39_62]OGE12324.1 MAG: hypothetical protein A3G14_02170 [Candidatus Curtissbacteria bacterium RIFCSPLOWO2_12_FULL_38_9]
MKRLTIFLLLPLSLLIFSTTRIHGVSLEECENDSSANINECIDLFSQKIDELGNQKNTLASQIAQYDTQIKVTQLKISEATNTIEQLEKEIGVLGFRIGYVSESIGRLEELVKKRIVATYQQSFTSNLELILASDDFADVMLRLQYLKQVQENDKKVLASLQETRSNYANQKDEREEKQAAIEENKNKLEILGASLDAQRKDKAAFLAVTKNDESRYQQLLSQARAEFEAIQAIIAGGGVETQVGQVNQGQKIATIIQGASCNSGGTHIHFTVRRPGGVTDNPFKYLKAGVSYEENSGGDPFNPSGDWEWPISPPIKFNQGYGVTWAVQNDPFIKQIYSFHNGIDINSLSSSEVKAVQNGTLYRGTYSGLSGCALRYVRVDHESSDLDTLYLHVNYLL